MINLSTLFNCEPKLAERPSKEPLDEKRKIIFYGVAGEGLGHAIRSWAIVEELQKDYDVHVFTSGDALEYYKKLNFKNLHVISGLRFAYVNGRVSIKRTILNVIRFVVHYFENKRVVLEQVASLKPACIISDFEPTLPRVAHKLSIPFASIDNQHKFSHCSVKDLPFKLKSYFKIASLFVKRFIPKPDCVIISNFHASLLKTRKKYEKNTVLTTVFLRKAFEKESPADENFVLVYTKKSINQPLIHSLKLVQRHIKIYGATEKLDPDLEYCSLSNSDFVRDLAKCSVLICPAGNQLIGEANYFGKPVFAIPEPFQDEQAFNAWCIEKMKIGLSCKVSDLSAEKIKDFVENHPCVKQNYNQNGLGIALKAIRHFIENPHVYKKMSNTQKIFQSVKKIIHLFTLVKFNTISR